MPNKAAKTLYWALIDHGDWRLHLAATELGLCYVGSPHQSFEELERWTAAKFKNSVLVHDAHKLQPYRQELVEYITGQRITFRMATELRGTPFQSAVWQALSRIPYGETATYADIAIQLGKPSAARAVGAAIGANPVLIAIPCHRVIGKNGALTGYRGGLAMKTELLRLEQTRRFAESQS